MDARKTTLSLIVMAWIRKGSHLAPWWVADDELPV
jgi:hypothetical protein